MTEFGSVSVVLKEALGNNTILFTIGVLILSATLEETGVTKKFVFMVASSKMIKGRPWMLTFVFLFMAYVAALFLNVIIPTLLLWTLIADLSEQVGYKPGDKWPMAMFFGVVYLATAASFVLPFQIGVIANFGILETVSNGTILYDTVAYIVWATICSLLLSGAYWILIRYIIRPDVTLLKNCTSLNYEKTPLTLAQKYAIVLFFSLIILLVGSNLLPAASCLASFFAKLETSGLTLGLIVIAISLRIGNKPVFDFATLFSKGMAWDIIMMLSTIFLMASALTEESTGIGLMVQQICTPFLSDMSPMLFLLLITLLITLLSNIAMNAAVCCTLIPIVYILAGDNSVNMVLFVAMINYMGGMALLLPCSSGSAALLYSQTQWVPKKNIVFLSFFTIIVTYFVITVIGIPLGNLIFHLS